MSVPTNSEKALLNTHPQRTQLYLSIYEPTIAFVCTVSGSYSSTNQSISYINGSGSLSGVVDSLYQVALVGTAPNDDSKGRTWVRSATGTAQLRFVESDHINWASGDVITVLNFTEIIPLFPRIIQNPADDTDVIFYKVWDIPYTNQNTILGTFVNMGCHYAGFRDDNGQYRVYWTASGTSNLIDDDLTYLWDFGNTSNPTGSTAHTPGWVVYPTGGHYRNILRVTSDSGREDISVRFVSLYDRPGQGSNVPLLNWEFSEPPNGSRDSTGYNWRIKLREYIPKTKIRDGALVVIFADDWYGGTRQSIGGNSEHKETVKFVGWIKDGSITTNAIDHSVEFECHSPTGVMEYAECFSCSVESKTSPTKWYELQNMNVQKAIYHYLAWHSTVLQVCDVRSDFIDRYIQYFDADRTSLYDAINTLISGARRGRVISDKQGMVWLEQEPEAIVSGSSVFSTTQNISKFDWIGEPEIDERQTDEVSFMEIGGIAYYPTTNTFSALLSDSPGVGPRYKGKVERIQGLALANQAELNDLSGQMLAYFNARYPNVEYKLRGNFGNVDIAPQEKFEITMKNTENNRNITWTDKDFVIRGVTWNWEAKSQTMYPIVRLAEVVDGFPGETIIIPAIPPDPDDPPVEPPPPPPPPPPPDDPEGSDTDMVCATAVEVRTTANFNAATPTWTDKTGAITGNIVDFARYTNDIAYALTASDVWKTENLSNASPTWASIYSNTSWDTDLGSAPDLLRIVVPNGGNVYVLCYSGQSATSATAFLLKSTNRGESWTASEIYTDTDAYDDFKVVEEFITVTEAGQDKLTSKVCVRYDDGDDVNPWAIVFYTADRYSNAVDDRIGFTFGGFDADDFSELMGAPAFSNEDYRYNRNGLLTVPERTTLLSFLVSEFSASYDDATPNYQRDAARVTAWIKSTISASNIPYTVKLYTVWKGANLNVPNCLAANEGVVYVGLKDKIVVSRSGGDEGTWKDYLTEHGAYDIHIPAFENSNNLDIIYWSTEGHLYKAYGTFAGPAVREASALLSESPAQNVPYRVVSDPDTQWPIFALDYSSAISGFYLHKLTAGTDETISVVQELMVSNIIGARSLRMYKSEDTRRLLYLDSSEIHYSVDDAETWQDDRKGSWTEYISPVRIAANTP